MKLKIMLVATLLVAMRMTAFAAAEATGHVSAYLGGKWLDSSDWAGADDQLAIGATVDFRKPTWPVNFAFDFIDSFGSEDRHGVTTDATVAEFAPGVRKYWGMTRDISLYIGGGPSLMYGSIKQSGAADGSDSDMGFGLWLGGGFLLHLNERMHLGTNLRFSQGDVHIFNKDRNAGGVLFNLIFGVNF